jgi:branched-chain amino acid transport system permease protein
VKNGVIVAAITLMVLLLGLPMFASNQMLHVLIMTALYSVLALSWNIIGGMCGQMMLGLSLFVGLGAYTSTVLYIWYGVTPWLGLLVGMLLAAIFGAILGYIIFKRRLVGVYFALVTLAVSEMGLFIALNWSAIGGANGLIIPPTTGLLAFQFAGKGPYYYIALAFLILTAGFSVMISRARFGYMLIAIRENEQTAAALGIDVVRMKVLATALSAAIAAAVGTFYAQYFLFIDADTVFGISLTIDAIVYSFIGGVGTALGPLVGAILLVPTLDTLLGAFGGQISGLHLVIYGLIIIIVMRVAPEGLLIRLVDRWRSKDALGTEAVP